MARSSQEGSSAKERISPAVFRTQPGRRYKLTPETRKALRRLSRRSARSGWMSPLEYNLTISHEHKFIWFRVAKVATRTILNHFSTHGVDLDVDHAMRLHYPTAVFDDYFKFAFVRNPMDRFISAWADKVVDSNYFGFDRQEHARMQRIEEFAIWTSQLDLCAVPETDHHLLLQSRLIDLSQVDHVGRLETFDADFAAICSRIGVPAQRAVAKNQSTPGATGRDAVSEELRTMITEMYRRDYQVFGY